MINIGHANIQMFSNGHQVFVDNEQIVAKFAAKHEILIKGKHIKTGRDAHIDAILHFAVVEIKDQVAHCIAIRHLL
jgi:hypothetical protein